MLVWGLATRAMGLPVTALLVREMSMLTEDRILGRKQMGMRVPWGIPIRGAKRHSANRGMALRVRLWLGKELGGRGEGGAGRRGVCGCDGGVSRQGGTGGAGVACGTRAVIVRSGAGEAGGAGAD